MDRRGPSRRGADRPREALSRISAEQILQTFEPSFDQQGLAEARICRRVSARRRGTRMAPRYSTRPGGGRSSEGRGRHTAAADHEFQGHPRDAEREWHRDGDRRRASHAAVVSRALDKPCIVGCETISIDPAGRTFAIGGELFREGDEISIDGMSGRVYSRRSSFAPVDRAGPHSIICLPWRTGNQARGPGRAEKRDRRPRIWGAVRCPASALSASPTSSSRRARSIDLRATDFVARKKCERSPSSNRDSRARPRSCGPLLAANSSTPVHIRLSRISSDRARRLIENWI